MIALLPALLVGAAYGFVAQRGAFCMNSGFRSVVTDRDSTKLKAYGLALAVQLLVLPSLFAFGYVNPTWPAMFPLAALVGGLLFGLSMRAAGGCAAGVWYKSGAGSPGAVVAVIGMATGAALLEVGPLAGVRVALQSVGPSPALGSALPWWAFILVGGLLLAALLRAAPGSMGAWSWRRTGLLMGLVAVAAWPASGLAGRDFGLAVVPGSVGLLTAPRTSLTTFDALLVLGIPLGAFLATRGPREPSERLTLREASRRLQGGVGLGIGASLAAGCTVGHGLTGVALLAPGSMLTILAIFAGSAITSWPLRTVDTHIG